MRNEGIVELYAPRRTLIGRDGITKIPHFLQRLSSKCVLVVTDKGLIKVGTAGKVTAVLDNANIQYVVYDGVEPNPTTRIVYDALHFYQEHQCDAIIAIGGGSPIDVAKAVSILSANGGKIQDYNGYNKSKKRGTPIIAVNTTAGTGSECTRAYVVTDEETKTKMLMVDTNCLAHLALNDPMLMVGMPPSLTAATGIDALTHAIEAYICNTHTPYTDALSLEAVRLVSGSLRDAVRDGSNMDARTNMCWAEYMAGLAFSNAGLGLVHGIAHQLGGFYNIPHGLANAILLPRVLEYNRPYCMGRLATVAQAMGEKCDNLSVDQASKKAIEAVRRLCDDVKIPKLCDTKFRMEDIDVLAEHALERKVQLATSEEVFRKTGRIFVPVASSARHVHLCRADVERLFGPGHQLTVFRMLSQPGQYACTEQVTIVGPKGQLAKVRVLGPERSATQVEIAMTDSFKLGIKAPVRMSGKTAGTPGCRLVGPAGEIELSEGVIIAARHLHLSEAQCALFGLRDGQPVRLRAEGERAVVFENVIVRSGKGHDMEVHIDTDEANAIAMRGTPMMEVLP